MNNLVGNAKLGSISSFLQHSCLFSCVYEEKQKTKNGKTLWLVCAKSKLCEMIHITYQMSDWCLPAYLRNWRERERMRERKKERNRNRKTRKNKQVKRKIGGEMRMSSIAFMNASHTNHVIHIMIHEWTQFKNENGCIWSKMFSFLYFFPSPFSFSLSIFLRVHQLTQINDYIFHWIYHRFISPSIPTLTRIRSHIKAHMLHTRGLRCIQYTTIFPQSLLALSFHFDLDFVP